MLHVSRIVVHTELKDLRVSQVQFLQHPVELQSNGGPQMTLSEVLDKRCPTMHLPKSDKTQTL